MTSKQLKQIYSSLGAIVLCVAFLWTGKKFIWNNAVPEVVQPDNPEASLTEPDTNIPQTTTLDSGLVTGDAGTTTTQSAVVTILTDLSGSIITQSATQTTLTTAVSGSSTASGAVTSTGQTSSQTQGSALTQSSSTASTATTASTTASTSAKPSITPSGDFTAAPEGYFADALFIGDSRMVGVGSYAPQKGLLQGAKYYADTGLASYKFGKNESSSLDFKGQKFADVLASNKFGKVYLMMGINELGNNHEATAKKFSALISQIQTAQPGVLIYVCANLHVTANPKTAYPKLVNNTNINALNSALQTICDNSTIYYLDVNPIFCDEKGYFKSDLTTDGVHPKAVGYIDWAKWFEQNVIVK